MTKLLQNLESAIVDKVVYNIMPIRSQFYESILYVSTVSYFML